MSQGADVNESDARGITALGLAVGYNKVALVKVLLDGGADVSKTDAKGSTVLHYAAGDGCYQKLFSILKRVFKLRIVIPTLEF